MWGIDRQRLDGVFRRMASLVSGKQDPTTAPLTDEQMVARKMYEKSREEMAKERRATELKYDIYFRA